MFNNKKGIVSIVVFSLSVLVLILILFGASYLSDLFKDQSDLELKKQEIVYSITSFRSELLYVLIFQGSNLTYQNVYDVDEVEIYLNDTEIKGEIYLNHEVAEVSISTLGVPFCSNYSFVPIYQSNFTFNGTCISLY